MNKKIAVVGIPGKWSTEVLADQLEAQTGYRLVVDMEQVVLDLTQSALFFEDVNLCELDAIVVKKITQDYDRNMWDRIELLRFAEESGVRVFSPSKSILQLVNRLGCTTTLGAAGIPMPPTAVTENLEQAKKAVSEFGQAVLKPMFSTKARGMTLLSTDQQNWQLELAQFGQNHPMMYIQKKADLKGWDLGMVFIGGEYSCTYARVSQSDTWNTTIHSGGKYAPYEPDDALIELGRRAQAPFELDFTTVDIALTDEGPIVFEVSAFGGFKGALEGAGVDAAKQYANYVLACLENNNA